MLVSSEPIEVKRILYKGQNRNLTAPLHIGNPKYDGVGSLCGNLIGYECPRCHENFGHYFRDSGGSLFFCGNSDCLKDDALCSDKSKATEIKHLDASEVFSLGSKYYNACLSKWRADNGHKELISRWISKPKNMLVLLGEPGTGKTYFCCAVANYFMELKKEVFYINMRRFIDRLYKSIADKGNQFDAIQKITSKEILIFDDLGSTTNTDWQKEVLLDLIDIRYSNEKPTIFTSNLSFKNMEDQLDKRIERRLNAPENLRIGVTHV